jgi:signal transduction histidine kinase
MIRTLYLRVVLTFLAIVSLSLVIAFFVTSRFNRDSIVAQYETELTVQGERIIELYKNTAPEDSRRFIDSVISPSYRILIYSSTGEATTFGSHGVIAGAIKEAEVNRVLEGEIFSSRPEWGRKGRLVIGLPFEDDGRRYALFLQPNVENQVKDFNRRMQVVLLVVLLTGSFLILVASRYLIHPLRVLTEATRRLAQGDFDVEVKLNPRDEMGVLISSFNSMARELKKIEQMRRNFISDVSHEIQSPLTSIRGFSKALKEQPLGEEERIEYLDIIEKESQRLSRLSENLLRLASLEAEHHPFNPVLYPLDEQVRRVVLALEPQWAEKKLELDLSLPPVEIVADREQLEQVWFNLIDNAVKFTSAGGSLSVGIEKDQELVRVTVADTGPGIPPQDLDYIFERFYKGDQSRDRSLNGSGIGLSIVKKIVALHRGQIQVESLPGAGTVFVVSLPAFPP